MTSLSTTKGNHTHPPSVGPNLRRKTPSGPSDLTCPEGPVLEDPRGPKEGRQLEGFTCRLYRKNTPSLFGIPETRDPTLVLVISNSIFVSGGIPPGRKSFGANKPLEGFYCDKLSILFSSQHVWYPSKLDTRTNADGRAVHEP